MAPAPKTPEIIAVIGGKGSGKDTAADYLATRLGGARFSTSQWLKSIAPAGADNTALRELAIALHEERGQGYMIDRALSSTDVRPLIISGLRHPDDVRRVLEVGGFVLEIQADAEVRRRRVNVRGRKGESYASSWGDISKHQSQFAPDNRLGAPDLGAALALASDTVRNNGTTGELYANLDRLFL